ncbi:hypothetical protein KOI35_36930 [Actinoplanes bogorensis]|uniref:DUF1349 domain-containing protein n=1 Tax=Paractinoplanes bogorensis TaxID=1610840 RepID=A0ABS5Z0D8_9ACTN|nr:hypothetical protein [Actinoplanes bogorensis]MBU2669113.1 hypothetical protein [Actinoplanes bogorensis]
MTGLERRYHRLMFAYPAGYRRGHATEMVTTLLEMADDGQTRPTRGDAWDLLVSGVRQRFRLPSGRPLLYVVAVLVTLIGGGFGAAAGSWAATSTMADLPSQAGIESLTRQIAGDGSDFHTSRISTPWTVTFADAGIDAGAAWTPDAARRTLSADGWELGSIQPRSGVTSTWDPVTGAQISQELRGSSFEATRDGLTMDVTAYVSGEHGQILLTASPLDNGTLLPLVIAGAMLGLLGGWLLVAAGGYRLRSSSRPRLASALTALAVVALAVPAFAFWVNVWRVAGTSDDPIYTVHSALSPDLYWSYGWPWMLVELSVAGLLLAVGAWFALRGRSVPSPAQLPA